MKDLIMMITGMERTGDDRVEVRNRDVLAPRRERRARRVTGTERERDID